MAIGPFVIDRTAISASTFTGTYFVTADKGHFTTDVILKSLLVEPYQSGTFRGRVVIFSAAGSLLYQSALESTNTVTGGTVTEIPLDGSGYSLTANTTYYIGIWEGGTGALTGVSGGTYPDGSSWTSTPAFTTWVKETASSYYGNSNSTTPQSPTNAYQSTASIGFSVASTNAAPTATNLSPSTFKDNRTAPAVFTWTYNDTEGNAQNAYEIRYRLQGSTGAWTTSTVSSATASHSYATGTFILGSDYEWQVRVSDAVAGYGEWSTLTYFTSGTSTWNYGPPVTTATQSGTIPAAFFSTDFEAADSLTSPVAWQNNNFFGTYTDCTIARTTTRPKTGSYSMEITWPTGAESRACSSLVTGLTVGSKYVFKADVYVPAGSPNISIDPFLQNNVVGALVTEKDQWITREVTFTAKDADVFFAFKTAGSTAGQKLFVDNVSVKDAAPTPGTYYVQVRTADAEGFGPWSASDTVVVRPPTNIYVKSGGTFTAKTNWVKVGGIWKQVPPTKRKSGGAFN